MISFRDLLASHLLILPQTGPRSRAGRGTRHSPRDGNRRQHQTGHVRRGGSQGRVDQSGRDGRTRELHRDTRGLPALESILQDIRYSIRTLRRDANLATFAILIIGLGVGASTTVFSVVNALLLRPLPDKDTERLAWIAGNNGEGPSAQTVQVGNLLDLKAQNRSFSDIAGYYAFYGVGDNKLTGTGEPERLTGVPVSENFFPLLSVQPQLGRQFTTEECRWNGPRAVLLSHRFWERRFVSDPGIVGRTLTLNDAPVTVVGVLPASFDFGAVFAPGSRVDLYLSFPLSEETNRWGNTLALLGRLNPGVTVEAAKAEMTLLGERISRDNPRRNYLNPRVATGDLRMKILLETIKLAVIGMIVGLVTAWSLGNMLRGLLFGITPSDPLTFAAALVLLMAVASLAGYLPARRASQLDPVEALRAE